MSDERAGFALRARDGRSRRLQTGQLTLQAVIDVRKLRLQARPDSQVNPERFASLAGSVLPADPLAATARTSSCYWLAPNDWLLLDPATDIGNLSRALREASGGATAVVTDATDAWSIIDVSGDEAAPGLAEGCSMDLDASVFPAGHYALTRLQRLPVIIHRLDGAGRFRILLDRSVAHFLWDWLAGWARP